jgi:hypothetical protein
VIGCAHVSSGTRHHGDGRVEESSLDGDGPFMPDAGLRLPTHADHWWKVRSRMSAQAAVLSFGRFDGSSSQASSYFTR